MTINIAITGSFSSGKSFVLSILDEMGYKVFSCDEYVRELYEDTNIREEILNSIPKIEEFNKHRLAKIIYQDKNARKILERIVHPMVLDGIKDFEQENVNEKIIFTEVPLLFEVGFDKYFSCSICVHASEKARLSWALKKRGVDSETFRNISATQFAPEVKKELADFAVDSEQEIDKIKESINEIIENIR